MRYVDEPAVLFGKEGESILRGRNNVHKVNVAHAVVNHTIDIEREEHYSKKELQTVGIVGKLELEFLSDSEVEREDYNSNVVEEILRCDYPKTVT